MSIFLKTIYFNHYRSIDDSKQSCHSQSLFYRYTRPHNLPATFKPTLQLHEILTDNTDGKKFTKAMLDIHPLWLITVQVMVNVKLTIFLLTIDICSPSEKTYICELWEQSMILETMFAVTTADLWFQTCLNLDVNSWDKYTNRANWHNQFTYQVTCTLSSGHWYLWKSGSMSIMTSSCILPQIAWWLILFLSCFHL